MMIIKEDFEALLIRLTLKGVSAEDLKIIQDIYNNACYEYIDNSPYPISLKKASTGV